MMKSLIAVISGMLLLTSTASAETTLRLLTFTSPPLVNAETVVERPSGTTISLIERLFELAAIGYKLSRYPPKRALHMASAMQNTCVLPIERSQEREPQLSWIGPVAISRHALYSKPDTPIALTTLEDARPYRISSPAGSGVGNYLDSLGFKIELARDTTHAYLMTEYGRTQLWAADVLAAPLVADELDRQPGNRELVIYTTQRYMGCHPETDPTLLKKLRDALAAMHSRDEVREMIQLEDM